MSEELIAMTSTETTSPDHAGVIAHPPLIYLLALIAGVALDAAWPLPLLDNVLQFWIGGGVIAVSLVIAISAFLTFHRVGTSVPTNTPTTALAMTGPYRYSRNPIYVALSLLYAGIAIAADNVLMLALLVPVLLIMNYGVVIREERYLARKFGADYLDYKKRVRRWV